MFVPPAGMHPAVARCLRDLRDLRRPDDPRSADGDGDGDARCWLIELRSSTEGHAIRLDPMHPLDVLPGLRTSDDCHGLALVADGAVSASNHPGFPTGSGVWTAEIALADGASQAWVSTFDDSRVLETNGCGLIADCLQRMLGCETPLSDLSTEPYWAAVWMADLLDLDPRVSALEAAAWHPAVDPRSLPRQGIDQLVDAVAGMQHSYAIENDWAALRSTAVAGWLDMGDCPPDLATWFDDGSFGRWMADQLPSLTTMAALAEDRFEGELRFVATGVLATLRHGQAELGH